jgi:hypothetical protein
MAEFRIPEDVARFVLEQIDSVAQLEALLLLRNDRDKVWNAPALAARLYIGEEETAHMLALLRDRGFVRQSGDDPTVFRYDPLSPELGENLERLAAIYAKHLVPVTNMIHSKPKPRIQEFADAFRIRRKDD